jgi:heme A synthase
MQPLLLAVGFTTFLIGVTLSIVLLIAGAVLFLATLIVWIRDARREFDHLPSEHHH